MTLISSLLERDGNISAISDTLLSMESESSEHSDLWPFNRTGVNSDQIRFVNNTQKTILIGKKIFLQWSGDAFTARMMIRRIIRDKVNFKRNPEYWIKNNLSDLDLDSICFIISWIKDKNMSAYLKNSEKIEYDWGTHLYSGTGSLFLEDNSIVEMDPIEVTEGEPPRSFLLSAQAITRCIVSEHTFDDFWAFRFGGWYELMQRTSRGFEKVPYVVVVWAVEKSGLSPIGLIGSRYKGGLLLVDRILPQSTGYEACYCVGSYARSGKINVNKILPL